MAMMIARQSSNAVRHTNRGINRDNNARPTLGMPSEDFASTTNYEIGCRGQPYPRDDSPAMILSTCATNSAIRWIWLDTLPS